MNKRANRNRPAQEAARGSTDEVGARKIETEGFSDHVANLCNVTQDLAGKFDLFAAGLNGRSGFGAFDRADETFTLKVLVIELL